METTVDQRGDLEIDPIDCTQPVQFHQDWHTCMVRPPQIEDRPYCRIHDGLQTTILVVGKARQRCVAIIQQTINTSDTISDL